MSMYYYVQGHQNLTQSVDMSTSVLVLKLLLPIDINITQVT